MAREPPGLTRAGVRHVKASARVAAELPGVAVPARVLNAMTRGHGQGRPGTGALCESCTTQGVYA